ncbi:hypothetical protein LIER_04050 [Lithospermum erythrorhizon]|uniref:PRA1 family protein n=1 Tax=Lithospermum erythrorhizon TaxID=34254 RepID=A0AAV3NWK4_LITER
MFFVFSCDDPLVVFGRVVNDLVVIAVLDLVTVVGLVFAGLGFVVFVASAIGVAVVGLHAGLRGVEDFFLTRMRLLKEGWSQLLGEFCCWRLRRMDLLTDENEAPEGGLISVVGYLFLDENEVSEGGLVSVVSGR